MMISKRPRVERYKNERVDHENTRIYILLLCEKRCNAIATTNIKYETGNEFSLLLKLKLHSYMYSDMNYAR